MPFIIDAHLDLAYNALTFGRDYLRPAAETRRLEQDGPTPERTGHSLLGWPEFQRGQVAWCSAPCLPRRAVTAAKAGKSWPLLIALRPTAFTNSSSIITAACVTSTPTTSAWY
jgi:hypothetical protein